LHIRQKLRRRLGYDVPLIGGSSPRIFVSLPNEGSAPVLHHLTAGIVLVLLCSREVWMNVGMLINPWDLGEEDRIREVQSLVRRLIESRTTHMGLGSSAQYDFFGFLPGPFPVSNGRVSFRDMEIHRQILDATDNSIKLFGASTCGGIRADHGYQFANDECARTSLALAVLESDLQQGSVMDHGLSSDLETEIVTVTKVKHDVPDGDYEVVELNRQSAKTFLDEFTEMNGTPRPLFGIGRSKHSQIAMPSNLPPYNPTVRFTRRLPRGTPLFLLKPTREKFHQETIGTLGRAIGAIATADNKPSMLFALGLECKGRYTENLDINDSEWMRTTTELGRRNPELTIVHALTGAEYGVDFRKRARADFLSAWFTVFSSTLLDRGFNRVLQGRFVEAARELMRCSTPKEVMEAALSSGMDCGASGGQICLYDPATEMLVGRHLGHAKSAHGGKQNWKAALSRTELRVPKDPQPYHLPEAFRQHVTAWPENMSASGSVDLPDETDILAIAGANRLAFYIPDSTLPESHCHSHRVQKGGVEAQFVLPLVGGSNALVGTLQIGFNRDKRMDREEIGLWVSYSQAVAAALELALQNQERTAMEQINKAWNDALLGQLERPDWDSELLKFTEIVKHSLRVSYVHLRIDKQLEPSGYYDIYGSVGDLAELHRKVRPSISEEEGSIKIARNKGILFTNVRKETSDFYAQASTPTTKGLSLEDQRIWAAETKGPSSIAIIELRSESRFEGAIILDSQLEYGFTERNQRLARFAAAKAASLVAHLRMVNAHNNRLDLALFAEDTLHSVKDPLAAIQQAVDVVRRYSLSDKALEKITLIEEERAKVVGLLKTFSKGLEVRKSQETVSRYLAREFPGRFSTTFVGDAQLSTNCLLTIGLTRLIENADEAAGDDGFVSCQWTADSSSIFITIENSGEHHTTDDVKRMRTPGTSSKSGDHLGIGLRVAETGIERARGELYLQPRAGGGLVATVKLPAISNRAAYAAESKR
jgi:signal transduction histidine kinase